jgi:hypothetical protein
MSTGWKFFFAFFGVHLVASVAYYFLAGQVSGSLAPGGGQVGVPMFGAMLFLLSGGQPTADATVLLVLPFNSAVTAGVATGIFQVVRRLRAA